MAKRGRPRKVQSLNALVDELKALDAQRLRVVEQIRRSTEALLSGESPFPWGRSRGRGPAAGVGQPGRRRRRMSKEARAKISAAQKARWAKQRAGRGK